MLHTAENLRDYELRSSEGEVGKVVDYYFDDHFWTVRYLVVETGGWLEQKRVLISPYAVAAVDEEKRAIRLNLTKEQIENSPTPETDPPVSRQFEMEYHDYYGWPYYWYGTFPWGEHPQPLVRPGEVSAEEKHSWDPHLRSAREVDGYRVAATDGDIGHVADFVIDDETWSIRYLVVDPRSWWPGRHMLMAPDWVERVDWTTRSIAVRLSRDIIAGAPEYDSEKPITREYEERLYRHYNAEGYWTGDRRLA